VFGFSEDVAVYTGSSGVARIQRLGAQVVRVPVRFLSPSLFFCPTLHFFDPLRFFSDFLTLLFFLSPFSFPLFFSRYVWVPTSPGHVECISALVAPLTFLSSYILVLEKVTIF